MSEATTAAAASSAVASESNEPTKDIEWKDAPRIIGSGFCMGSADVVPGVSGGTMAVACGIYENLLAAIASVNGDSIRALLKFDLKQVLAVLHWRFLVSLGLGLVFAIVIMLKVVGLPRLLEEHPTEVYAVFFGLVFASIGVLARRIPSWGPARGVSFLVGTVLGWATVNLVPVDTPESSLFIFFAGMIAISAMLLPGISGSFILLILGKYEYVIGAVERLIHLDLSALGVVVPFALGCLVGIAAFSRFLSWLLRRWHDTVLAGLAGLLLGSLWRIWPYQDVVTAEVRGKTKIIEATPFLPDSFNVGVIALMVAGVLAVVAVEVIAHRRRA